MGSAAAAAAQSAAGARRVPLHDAGRATCSTLRGAMTPAHAARVRGRCGGLAARRSEDAWQRAVEFLFERLAVRWEIAGRRADHAPEGAARPLPLRLAGRARAGSATCCASTWPSTSPSWRRREPPDPDALRRGCCAATASTCSRASRSSCARRRSPRRCCSRSSASCSSARRGRCCGSSCRARTRAGGRRRATRTSTASRPPSCAEAEQTDAVADDPGAGEHDARWPASTRRGWRAPPARGRRCARRRCARRWCGTLWPTPAGAQQAGMGTAEFAAFVRRATVPRPRRPGGRLGASCSARQARLIERLARRARAAHRGRRAPTCALRVDGRTWVNSDGRRNMPSRRGLHRAARGLRRGPHPLHDPVEPARRRGRRASSSSSATAWSSTRAPSAATTTCWRRSTPTRAPAASARSGSARTTGIDRADRRDPVRREDRRHRPPRARPLLSGDRRHERVAPSTGT